MLLMLGIVVAKADTRRVLFDAGWQFTQNGKTVTVDLPHDWDIYAGPDAKSGATGTGGGWYPGGKGEYRKMFKTPDGEVVYAKPIREFIPIDFEESDDGYPPFALQLTGKIADPKDAYADGEEVGIEVTLRNVSGEPLTEYAIGGVFGPEDVSNADSALDNVPSEGTLEAGQTWTKTFNARVRHYWDTDDYRLVLSAEGKTESGHPAVSNSVTLPVQVLAGDKPLE